MSYVYAYLDPRKPGLWQTSEYVFEFEPFYIGEGRGRRIFSHLDGKGPNPLKTNKINKLKKLGLKPIILKIYDNISPNDARKIETKLIREIGTCAVLDSVPRGPLLNAKIQDEDKHIFAKGKKRSQETINKWKSSYAKMSDESRKRISEGQRNIDPITRLRMTQSQFGRKTTIETKLKLSVATTRKNSKTWKISFANNAKSIVVTNLKLWCSKHGYVYSSVKHTATSGKFYRGLIVSIT